MPEIQAITASLEAFQKDLFQLLETESIPQVAQTHKRIILGLTDEGVDAMGEVFHPYSESYAKERRNRLGLGTGIKDLRVTGDMLDSLALDGDTLTVSEENQKIALGQMSGHNGDWGYVHDFLDVSQDSNDIAATELTTFLKGRI